MAALRSFEEKRARIRALAAASPGEAAPELKKLLADRSGYLVGETAEVVKKLELSILVPELAAAFFRFLEDPVRSDKGCFAKNRLVEALLAFDAHEPDVYLRGLCFVQKEPAFEKPVDAAAGLRGLCAHALVHIRHPRALLEIAPMLFDPEPVTRAEAAAALGSSGADGAAAVLHVKVIARDAEPDVMGACYKALLRIAPERYLKLVGNALSESDGDDGMLEAAALALGESRVAGALGVLKQAARSPGGRRAAEGVLLAIALLRSDAANDFLLSLVAGAPEGEALGAVSALALHRHDDGLVARLRTVLAARKSRKLAEAFDAKFGASH